MSLRHARSHGSDPRFRHELHGNASLRVHVFQVVDELSEIFNGINIVMRRRRDQSDPCDGVPQSRNDFVDFVAGKLAALPRLGALRHLDLQLVRVHQIICGYAETRRSHLLNRAAPQIPVCIRREALFVFSAFASVRLASDAVHGEGEGFMRLFADRTE